MTIEGVGTVDNTVFKVPEVNGQEMGKSEFLQLMTAQLKSQDPMNPQKDQDFVAQLAQFSNLEQSLRQTEKLEQLQMSSAALVNSTTSDLIGREILAHGDTMMLRAGEQPPKVHYALGEQAHDVSLRIMNADGAIVRKVELGAQGKGDHSFAWDGRDDEGNLLPAGMYRIEVMAADAEGLTVASSTNVSGIVTGVTYENGVPELMLGETRIQPANIIEVRERVNQTDEDEAAEDTDGAPTLIGGDGGGSDLDFDFSSLMDGLNS